MKYNKGFAMIAILGIILGVLALGSSGYYIVNKNIEKEKLGNFENDISKVIETDDKSINNTDTEKLVFDKKISIKKVNGTKIDEKIIDLTGYNFIKRWSNYLFYTDVNNKNLIRYNVETNKKDVVYVSSDDLPISSVDITTEEGKESLFFTVSSYRITPHLFFLQTPESNYQEISNEKLFGGLRIENIDGIYWVIGGEGDECVSSSNYSILNTINKNLKYVATFNHGCAGGKELIRIDTKNKQILAYNYEVIKGSKERGGDAIFDYYELLYKDIVAIPFDDPTNTKILMDTRVLPNDIYRIQAINNGDQLILVGNSGVSLLDLNTLKIKKVENTLKEWIGNSLYWKNSNGEFKDINQSSILNNDMLCISRMNNVEGFKTNYYLIDFKNGVIEKNSNLCLPSSTKYTENEIYKMRQEEIKEGMDSHVKKYENLFSGLKLPSNYKLIFE